MHGLEYHTLKNDKFRKYSLDFLKIPRIRINDNIMKEWFSINKSCYSSLLALRFRLLCLRIHLHKRGPTLPNEVYNGSTFDLTLTYEEYIGLFINNNFPENLNELVGEVMYLLCILIDNADSNSDWATFIAIELFSTAYSLDDEKTIWYITISECNKNVNYTLPEDKTLKWSRQISIFKKDMNSNISHINDSNNLKFNNSNSLNPTNGTLDFLIISILQLLMDPKYSDINIIFKNYECDPDIFSIWRLPNDINILSRCSQIWSGQHIAYRCLTCGTTTSSCICVDCFQNGNHENHEYYIYKSDYGGCCDCGDEQAWKKSGFCNKHKCNNNYNDENDCHIIDQSSYINLKGFFHGILCHVVCLSRLYCTAPQTKEIYLPFHSKLISKIVEQNRSDHDQSNLDIYLEENNFSDYHELNILPNFLLNDLNNQNNVVNNNEDDDSMNIINIMNIINHGYSSNSHSNHPVLLLLKQNKHFQMDSYFFQWFIYLCENYQLVFMPLLGELIGSPIHSLLMYGIKYKSILDHNNKSNKYTCKLLKPLIENYYFKRRHIFNKKNNKVYDLLLTIHPEFKKKNKIFLEYSNYLDSASIVKDFDFTNYVDSLTQVNSINVGNHIDAVNSADFMNNKEYMNHPDDINKNDLNNLNDLIYMNPSNQVNTINSVSTLESLSSLNQNIQTNSVNHVNLVSLVNHMNHMNLINQANIINNRYNHRECTYFPIYKDISIVCNQSNTMIDSYLLFKKDLFTYLDLFWMKWSRQLNEANESIIYQTLVSKIYKQNDLTDLLLILMFNTRFKESIFPDIFLRNYSDLVQRQDKVLTRIAVQLFTIDRMIICMALDNNLIQIIFYTTFQIFQGCVFYNHYTGKNKTDELIVSNTLPTIYSYSNAITNRKYTYSMHDSKYILQCIDLLLFIFFNKCTNIMYDELISRNIIQNQFSLISERMYLDLWHNGWLALIRLMQCMNPHKSKHIESTDDSKWHSSLLLCCDVQSTVDILLQIISILLKSSENDKLFDDFSLLSEYRNKKYDSLAIYRLTINTIQSLIQWIYIISINESWNIEYEYIDLENEEYEIYEEYEFEKCFLKFKYNEDFITQNQYLLHNISIIEREVSIHIPLHRASMELLYIFLDYMTTLNKNNDALYIKKLLRSLGIINDIMKLSILEHPIRAYCFVNQAFHYNDNIWIRNGLNPINEAQFYKKSHWSTIYLLLDLFSIRIMLNLLDNQDNLLFLFNSVLIHFNVNEEKEISEKNKELDLEDRLDYYKYLNVLLINQRLNKALISCLYFLMDIITKISSIDLPLSLSFSKSTFRYLLVQYLIRKNRSRSEIQDGLPITSSSSMYYGNFIHSTKSANLNNIIDEILTVFCDIIPATDKKPMLYKMKQPLGWMLYDPLLPITFSNDDIFISEVLFSFLNDWFDNSNIFDNKSNPVNNINKKRRIEISATSDDFINDHCNKDDHYYEYDCNFQCVNDGVDYEKFIKEKFFKFPMKICHIPRSEHFISSISFSSTLSLYVKSLLFCNIIHLSLPQLIKVDISQTILEDIRIIHQTFILLFNLINIEIINYFYDNKNAKDLEDVYFECENIFNYLKNEDKQEENEKKEKKKELLYKYFSISKSEFHNNMRSKNESLNKNKTCVSIIEFNEHDENDDYQYLIISPDICNHILHNKSEYSNKNALIDTNTIDPIILDELNIYQIHQQLLRCRKKSIFDILVNPIKLNIKGFENNLQYEKPFCLLDILIEVIYSLRVKNNESYLSTNSSKFKFVDKDILKTISLESSFFLEWGLSIARNTHPYICDYFDKYLDKLYNQYKYSTIKNFKFSTLSSNSREQIISKQKNILQEYFKKQKNFIKNHQNSLKIDFDNHNSKDIEVNDIKDGIDQSLYSSSDIDYCIFCHESIEFCDKDTEIATFGYLDLQNISLNSRKNLSSKISFNGFHYISNYTSFYLTICGHFMHYKCVEQYYKLSINDNCPNSERNSNNEETYNLDNSEYSLNLNPQNYENESYSNLITSTHFVNFPLISSRNTVKSSIIKNTNGNVIQEIDSLENKENSFKNIEHREYDYFKDIYHHTNMVCPYCNINSNVLIPFKFRNKYLEKKNHFQYNISDQNFKKDHSDLFQILNEILKLQYNYNLFIEIIPKNIKDIQIDVKCYPMLQQLLPILNSFNNLLPYDITGNRVVINGVSCINPISLLIKLLNDNILIDVISKDKITNSSSRYLLYDILIDYLKNIIKSFPILSDSLLNEFLKKIFPSENELIMDIWTFIILQSPSSRFQLLLNLIILIDNKEQINDKAIEKEHNLKLDLTHIMVYIFLIEIFSIIWTFWNSEWDNEKEVFVIKNPIIQLILKLNREKNEHLKRGLKKEKQKFQQVEQSEYQKSKNQHNNQNYKKKNHITQNEITAISFFQQLVNGMSFNLTKKYDPKSNILEYKANKIKSFKDSRIIVNSFGAIPIQITSNNELNNKNYSQSFEFETKVNSEFGDIDQFYPNYILNSDYTINIKEELLKDEHFKFKLSNIKDLKKIVNFGILAWLECILKFQCIYFEEGKNKINYEKFMNEYKDIDLDHLVELLISKLSVKLCFNHNSIIKLWKILTIFDNQDNQINNDGINLLLKDVINKINYFQLVSRKKIFIPLISLEILLMDNSATNHTIQIYNEKIDSYYKVISLHEYETIKNSFYELSKRFVHIDNNIIVIRHFDQPTILPPKMFHNLYNKFLSNPVMHWSGKLHNNINQILLCLSCGTVLCTEYNCCNESESNTTSTTSVMKSYFYCYTQNNHSKYYSYSIPFGSALNISYTSIPIRDHIAKCGKGLSFFLHISSSVIVVFRIDLSSTKNNNNNVFNWIDSDRLLIYGGRASEFSSLYVDEYGEEDKHLVRGKPLTLCPYRWTKLQNIFQRLYVRRNACFNWYSFQPFEFLHYLRE